MPAVSVITPAYNAAAYLGDAIQSVRAQTFENWELIVVDDGSTDRTVDLVESFQDRDGRIRLLAQANAGPSAARNRAMRAARGRVFAFLDSDDGWAPEYLASQLAVLDRHADTSLVTGNAWIRGGPANGSTKRPDAHGYPVLPLHEIITNEAAVFIMTVFRREVFDTIGGMDEAQRTSEDYDFWIRAALAGFVMRRNPRPLGYYRYHEGGASRDTVRMLRGMLRTYEKTRPMLAAASPALFALDTQVARFEEELLLAEAKAALERGSCAEAADRLRRLRQRRGGMAIGVTAWLAERAPRVAGILYRARRFRPHALFRRGVAAEMPPPIAAAVQPGGPVATGLHPWTEARGARGRELAPLSARTRLVSVVKATDRALGRAFGPRQVLVEVRGPMNLEVLRPIWSALACDPRVELSVTAEETTWVRPALAEAGLADRLIPRTSAVWRRFDLGLNADPWNALDLRRCARRVNVFHGVAGKYDLDDPRTLGRVVDFTVYDTVMFPNADRLQRYVSAGVVRPERAALVGFPKTDALVNGRWSAAAVRAELGLDPALETVLYAPTFSPASSLHLAGEAIIERLLADGRNVVVKLHDRSMVPHPKFTRGVDWPARLARFAGRPNYAFADRADAAPYLAASDVMVTDHSTVGFEFALLDRPLIVFDAPALLEAARINPEKWHLLRDTADIVRSVDELPVAVARALAAPWRHALARRAVAQALFAYAGRATERALAVVYDLLELDMVPEVRGVREVREKVS